MGLYRRKDSPYWWYSFTNGKKEKINKSTGEFDRKVAQAIYEQVKTYDNMGKHFNRLDKVSFRDLVSKYLETCKRQPVYETKIGYFKSILAHVAFKDKLASAITREDCLRYQRDRASEVKESSVNREMSAIRNCFNVAINDLGYKLENPVKNLKFFNERKFRRDRFMSPEEQSLLFEDRSLDQEPKDLYMFAIKTGLRQGEIRELCWADINMKTGLICVRAGNEDKVRFVPMHLYVRNILEKRLASHGPRHGKYVFGSVEGSKLSRDGWITTAFEWACRRNGITNLHFHDLRHTFASEFVMAGGDFKTLGEYMGHSTLRMTERYAHLAPKYRASQITLLPAVKAFENSQKNTTPVLHPQNGHTA